MNHKRWPIICQTFAGCTILGILCSRSVTWRGFIHDLKQLNERNTVRTHGFTCPVSSWVFSSPPQKSHPSYPCHNHTLAQNEQKITTLCSACHPLMETRNSLEFRELEAGHMHYTLDTAIYLHSWYFEVSCMLFSFPEINLLKKKKREKNPQSFRGIRNQFQETLWTLIVNAATKSKCILMCVCVYWTKFFIEFHTETEEEKCRMLRNPLLEHHIAIYCRLSSGELFLV